MIPTALSAQSGALLTPALPVPSFGGFRPQRTSGLRVRRLITVASTGTVRFPKSRADRQCRVIINGNRGRTNPSLVGFPAEVCELE
jgi:hypothetical protein